MKTAQYYAMHPLNGQYSHWIDDKLTLKYLCAGTRLDCYMPKYYFQIDAYGKLLYLSDAPETGRNHSMGDIAELLENLREIAVKRIAGSLGEGFFKASYRDGVYFLNSEGYTREQFVKKLQTLREYLVMEYLHPHTDMAPFSPDTVNTIRYLVARDENRKLYCVKSFVRFGTEASGYVENYGAGGILCFISENGSFESGNLQDKGSMKNKKISVHPDKGIPLKGKIPLWPEIQRAADALGEYFPQLDYMGIDFVVTDTNEVKILEVNSLSSLDVLQIQGSVLEGEQGSFYKTRIKTK